MTSQRELCYYASIPKLLLLLIVTGGLAPIGWSARTTSFNAIIAWILILAGCSFGAPVGVAIFVTIVLRRPTLRVNEEGFISTSPFTPWRRTFLPWADVTRVGIRTERHSTGIGLRYAFYYFTVYERDDLDTLDGDASEGEMERFSGDEDSLLFAYAPINVQLNMLFLRASRRQRARMLERVQQTFMPEIIQYRVVVDEAERVV